MLRHPVSQLSRTLFPFDSIFDELFGIGIMPADHLIKGYIPVNTFEDNGKLTYEFIVPGTSRSDLDLTLDKCVLKLSVKSSETKRQSKHEEFNYSMKRDRQFILPENIDLDSMSATYEGGILKVSFNRKESAEKVRKIPIE